MKGKFINEKLLVLLLLIAFVFVLIAGKNNDKKIAARNAKYISEYEEVQVSYNLPRISCWGDSLTVGIGGDGITYPDVLSEMSKLEVNNYGVSWEGAWKIAIRQGAVPVYVKNVTIPKDDSTVKISLVTDDGDEIVLGKNGYAGINPCIIGGVEGTITYNKKDGKNYFKRSDSGEQIKITEKTQLITKSMQDKDENDILVIFIGSYNTPDSKSIKNVIKYQKKMIEYANTDKYVVIGMTSKSYMDEVEEVNEILAKEYGDNFLDIREYMLKNGLKDANIKATDEDLEDIENGEIPSSLRSDDIHGNSSFYTILGEQVYKKLIDLGYIS